LALAQELGCNPSQLAIAWLLHKAPHIVPIPGTTSIEHLHDDLGALDVKLNADLMLRLEAMIGQHNVVGNRYNDQANSEVDTEVFA
jgi:aryl-alcohol dehydrogenase-like predicted oxidoreductase